MSDKLITKRDVVKGWSKYYLSAEVASGFERLTAPAFSFGMEPVLTKLYHDSPEEYKAALKRQLMFFNSEATWGSMIFGISCALEEERAIMLKKGASQEELDASSDMITNLKVGLMGPLAGIGDSVNHGIIQPLLLSIFIPLASAGLWIAGVAPLIIWGVCISLFAYMLSTKGYSLGKKSVVNILQSGALSKFIDMASVLGLFMMGALSSTYIKLTTAISWTDVSGKQILLQDHLNTIFPKLLPLLVVFGVYLYIKKFGPKYVRILISLLVISVVLSFFGIV
ncbi:TPA: PTS system mannose/fructose/sorbose family transporter subunit IID [Klebsiella pneumoniae]|nr:PTS system mannose/fructose/sorbose family transporter subunit IID [Klebsiella pneumoniae]